jgi:repressor LexA
MTRETVPEETLSPKARRILDFIARTQETHGAPPTLREIGERFRIRSTNGVRYYIDRLEREGALRRRPGRARGLTLARAERPDPAPARRIPILGRIAAGDPVAAAESRDGVFDLAHLERALPDFALRVRGESMRDAGILDGDLVLVRRDPSPRNGVIVVARIGEETTVKRFFREKRRILLKPENAAFEPISVTETSPELQILGRVVGVFREIG